MIDAREARAEAAGPFFPLDSINRIFSPSYFFLPSPLAHPHSGEASTLIRVHAATAMDFRAFLLLPVESFGGFYLFFIAERMTRAGLLILLFGP